MASDRITAAMVAIGDELLSGRTRDINIHKLAGWLTERGVDLKEVRIVSDEEGAIAEAVNILRERYTYVFTSGGIGPTHDDITAPTIATAFGVAITERPDAVAVLKEWYDAKGDELTPARLRMARVPDGASLIENNVSGAPGFRIENVFVMAGVPSIFAGMLENIDPQIERGAEMISRTITGAVLESEMSAGLEALQKESPLISIGSYPGEFAAGQTKKISIVLRGTNPADLDAMSQKVGALMEALGASPEIS